MENREPYCELLIFKCTSYGRKFNPHNNETTIIFSLILNKITGIQILDRMLALRMNKSGLPWLWLRRNLSASVFVREHSNIIVEWNLRVCSTALHFQTQSEYHLHIFMEFPSVTSPERLNLQPNLQQIVGAISYFKLGWLGCISPTDCDLIESLGLLLCWDTVVNPLRDPTIAFVNRSRNYSQYHLYTRRSFQEAIPETKKPALEDLAPTTNPSLIPGTSVLAENPHQRDFSLFMGSPLEPLMHSRLRP